MLLENELELQKVLVQLVPVLLAAVLPVRVLALVPA
jgi:hypothetical protein